MKKGSAYPATMLIPVSPWLGFILGSTQGWIK
jgi:hypothetical protein